MGKIGAARGRRLAVALVSSSLALLAAVRLAAYETDQFTDRLLPIADSTGVLNVLVNRELEAVASSWKHGRNERRFTREVFWRLGGLHWVDKLERWARRSRAVERIPIPRGRSVYAGMPFWVSRAAFFFGVGDSIRVNDSLIGTDKIGHFLSQGRKYHRHFLRAGKSRTRVVRIGQRNETGIFGRATTGVYSNADLVANYEGYLFYRSLFEDGIAGKPSIVRWDGERPVIRRPFDWADHVNDYWDEALNPSRFSKALQKRIVKNLRRHCPEYFASPESWVPRHEEELRRRYAELGLKTALYNRLDRICEEDERTGRPEEGER